MKDMSQEVKTFAQRIAAEAARRAEDPEYQRKVAAEETERAAVSASIVKQYRDSARKRIGLPARSLPLLASPQETDAVRAVRSFLDRSNPRTMLVLAGGTGCGKTVAACVGLDEFLQVAESHGFPSISGEGMFVKAIDLVRAGTFDGEYWDSLHRTPLLVIDDMGWEPLDEKGWALANIGALLDGRYDASAKTILTTNLPLSGFKARYCSSDGGRLVDRLREVGAFLEFDGASMRKPVQLATPPVHWQEAAEDRP